MNRSITQPSASRRLEYLDSMRGVAALAVVYYHACAFSIVRLGLSSGWEYSIMNALSRIEDTGKTGVVLFFAISGYVIPMSFRPGPYPIANFALSRLFRLYPAYWLSLALALALAPWLVYSSHYSLGTVLANTTMLQTAFGKPDVIGVYWTLFIEWIFYGFCIVAFALGKLGESKFCFVSSLFMLAIALFLAVIRNQTHLKLPVALPLALSIMIWASLWRNFQTQSDRVAGKLALVYLVVFAAALPVVSLLAYNYNSGFDETWYRYFIGYVVGMASFLIFSSVVRLTGAFFVWLGSISYSLYLLHPLVAQLIAVLQHRLPFGSAHLYFLEVASVSVLASHGCYVLIEAPCIKLGQLARKKLQSRSGSEKTRSHMSQEW